MCPDQSEGIRDKRGKLLRQPSAPRPAPAKPPPASKPWKPADVAVATKAARRTTKVSPFTRGEILMGVPPAIPTLTVSTQEARRALSIGNSLLWRLIMSGRLETIKLASKRLVLVTSIEKLVEEQRAKGNT
jgi:hypothetical protein